MADDPRVLQRLVGEQHDVGGQPRRVEDVAHALDGVLVVELDAQIPDERRPRVVEAVHPHGDAEKVGELPHDVEQPLGVPIAPVDRLGAHQGRARQQHLRHAGVHQAVDAGPAARPGEVVHPAVDGMKQRQPLEHLAAGGIDVDALEGRHQPGRARKQPLQLVAQAQALLRGPEQEPRGGRPGPDPAGRREGFGNGQPGPRRGDVRERGVVAQKVDGPAPAVEDQPGLAVDDGQAAGGLPQPDHRPFAQRPCMIADGQAVARGQPELPMQVAGDPLPHRGMVGQHRRPRPEAQARARAAAVLAALRLCPGRWRVGVGLRGAGAALAFPLGRPAGGQRPEQGRDGHPQPCRARRPAMAGAGTQWPHAPGGEGGAVCTPGA